MSLERCKNCEKAIGNLEHAYVYNGNILCKECNERIRAQEKADQLAEKEQFTRVQQSIVKSQAIKKRKSNGDAWIWGVLIAVGLIVGVVLILKYFMETYPTETSRIAKKWLYVFVFCWMIYRIVKWYITSSLSKKKSKFTKFANRVFWTEVVAMIYSSFKKRNRRGRF